MTLLDSYSRRTLLSYQIRNLALALFSIGFTVAAAEADIGELNGVCVLNCGSPGTVSFGQSAGPTPFNLAYTAPSTDKYLIAGTYAASYGAQGTVFTVDLSATYAGVSPSIANDTFKVDVLQNFFDISPGTWDGLYTESVPAVIGNGVGPGSSTSVQFLWDGQSAGLITFSGPGTFYKKETMNLTGLDGDTLASDFQTDFTFGEGTLPSSTISITSPTPEPAEALPVAVLVLGLLGTWLRRKSVDGTLKVIFKRRRI